jgi:hypothetical protein
LIVPIDSSSPDTAAGTQFNGKVSSDISTLFNFDIPQSDSGKKCNLVFFFPEQADLQTSSFTFHGDGKINVAELSEAATTSTSFNNAPSVAKDLGEISVSPGHSFVITTFSCPAGEKVAFEMKNAGTTDLEFFEDFNPSPLVSSLDSHLVPSANLTLALAYLSLCVESLFWHDLLCIAPCKSSMCVMCVVLGVFTIYSCIYDICILTKDHYTGV